MDRTKLTTIITYMGQDVKTANDLVPVIGMSGFEEALDQPDLMGALASVNPRAQRDSFE